ncbi:MAG: hypothetical protein HJJLKODD_01805 [Phycisphaerae bacterium]|nr:hypothetical protein [Phycisphaerae bacterium]
MKKLMKGFTLIELLVVVAIIALLISILLPSLAKARETAKQTACSANVTGIGKACYTYSEDAQGWFPSAAHRRNSTSSPIIDYIGVMGGGADGGASGAAYTASPARNAISSGVASPGGSVEVSTTRSLWLLIRKGTVQPKTFICPSSEDKVDPTIDTTTYYDFIGFGHESYGYQIPYDSTNPVRPSADVADPRLALMADRGPYTTRSNTPIAGGGAVQYFNDMVVPYATELYDKMITFSATGGAGITWATNSDGQAGERGNPDKWRPWNSPNHGGPGIGQGQSILYPDMHAEFNGRPTGGVDNDNIYTKALTNGSWTGTATLRWWVWGQTYPTTGDSIASEYLPGYSTWSPAVHMLTDTLIYP